MTTYTIVINVLAHPFDDEVVQLQIHPFQNLMHAASFYKSCLTDKCVKDLEVLINGQDSSILADDEQALLRNFMLTVEALKGLHG